MRELTINEMTTVAAGDGSITFYNDDGTFRRYTLTDEQMKKAAVVALGFGLIGLIIYVKKNASVSVGGPICP